MMQGMFDSGSNGAVQKLMQQKMLEEMFGLKANERPVDGAAEPVGLDPNGSYGILGIRLYAPTMTSPTPRLELETNGRLSIHPDELKALASFLQANAERFATGFAEQEQAATKLEGAEIFGAMIGDGNAL